jgi:hypothetical protein
MSSAPARLVHATFLYVPTVIWVMDHEQEIWAAASFLEWHTNLQVSGGAATHVCKSKGQCAMH